MNLVRDTYYGPVCKIQSEHLKPVTELVANNIINTLRPLHSTFLHFPICCTANIDSRCKRWDGLYWNTEKESKKFLYKSLRNNLPYKREYMCICCVFFTSRVLNYVTGIIGLTEYKSEVAYKTSGNNTPQEVKLGCLMRAFWSLPVPI